MNWFKKTKYPDFWKSYLKHFEGQQDSKVSSIRFVVFDTETTGLNTKTDRVLSIGTVGVNNYSIGLTDTFECYLKQEFFNPDTVKIHGLLKEGQLVKLNEREAIIEFLKYIENAVLVAHHAAFDIAMINESLKRINLPKLKNRVIDTGYLFNKTESNSSSNQHISLDELSKRFNIPLHDRHTASGDAYITALIFLKMIVKLKKDKKLQLGDLSNNNRVGLM